jgi:hypothetical protein
MTPQQLKAMKLALEALDIAQGMLADLRSQHQPKMLSAYTALEEVLAEHAMCEVQRLGQEIEQKIGCVNHDCDQCKAQPEQEPVIGKWSLREVYFDEDGEPISHRSPPQRTEQPAQRTWVGLTEQDLDYLCNLAYTGDEEFALAVQAKLMEKNA